MSSSVGAVQVPEGVYPLMSHTFTTAEGVKFHIRERKTGIAEKPREYLCVIEVQGVRRFQYISSLYPQAGEQNSYLLECGGVLYELRMEGESVEIRRQAV